MSERPGRRPGRPSGPAVGQGAALAHVRPLRGARCFAAVIVLFPIYSAVVVAIQPAPALLHWPGVLLPTDITLGTFREAFDQGDLGQYLRNSVIQSSLITVGQVDDLDPGRLRVRLPALPGQAHRIFFAFLATLMVPDRGHVVAQFEIVSDLGWLNTYPGSWCRSSPGPSARS